MNDFYTPSAMAGRPPSKEAPPFGRRLAAARKARGLSQVQLARLLDTTQKTIDYYERRAANPTMEVVERAAAALDVPVTDLLGVEAARPPSRRGPAGKLRKVFESASALPRRQQEKIAEFVALYIQQYEQSRAGGEDRA